MPKLKVVQKGKPTGLDLDEGMGSIGSKTSKGSKSGTTKPPLSLAMTRNQSDPKKKSGGIVIPDLVKEEVKRQFIPFIVENDERDKTHIFDDARRLKA